MEENKIRDDSDDKSYFTISPRVVWAMCKSVYEYTLWGVVKDIAGDNGECYVSTENLAVLAMMSTGKVSESRKGLLETGLLVGELKPVSNGQNVWHLSVPNLWPANVEFVEENRSIAERVEYKKQQKASLHQVKASPHEGKPSPGETKNIPKEEQTITPLAPLTVEEEKEEKPQPFPADDSYTITYHFKNKDHVRTVGNWTNGPWAVSCDCGGSVQIEQLGTAVECLCGMHEYVLVRVKPETKIERDDAVEAYLLIAGRKRRSIAQEWLDEISTTVTDVPFWRRVVKEYCGCGWNRGNVSKMLEYYKERKIPGTRQKLTPEDAKPDISYEDGKKVLTYRDGEQKGGPRITYENGVRVLNYD